MIVISIIIIHHYHKATTVSVAFTQLACPMNEFRIPAHSESKKGS